MWQAPAVILAPQGFLACDFDLNALREGVDDGDADPVQTARRLVGLVRELAAGVEHSQHHLQSGLVFIFGVRIDGNAAAIIGDGDIALRVNHDLDPVRPAGNGLVHRVVEDFREQVVIGALVRAANIHARTSSDGLQAFEDLDVGSGIPRSRSGLGLRSGRGTKQIGLGV